MSTPVSELLLEYHKKMGYSVRIMGAALGVSQEGYRKMLTGEVENPSVLTAFMAAIFLKIPAHEIFMAAERGYHEELERAREFMKSRALLTIAQNFLLDIDPKGTVNELQMRQSVLGPPVSGKRPKKSRRQVHTVVMQHPVFTQDIKVDVFDEDGEYNASVEILEQNPHQLVFSTDFRRPIEREDGPYEYGWRISDLRRAYSQEMLQYEFPIVVPDLRFYYKTPLLGVGSTRMSVIHPEGYALCVVPKLYSINPHPIRENLPVELQQTIMRFQENRMVSETVTMEQRGNFELVWRYTPS